MALAQIAVGEQRRHDVDAGLDQFHGVARQQREVDAQAREGVRGRLAARQHLAGVAEPEAHHVPDAVREEDVHRPALHEPLGLPAEQAERNEAFGDRERRGAMDLFPLGAGQAALGRDALGLPDDLVQLGLLGREAARRGIGARDVARAFRAPRRRRRSARARRRRAGARSAGNEGPPSSGRRQRSCRRRGSPRPAGRTPLRARSALPAPSAQARAAAPQRQSRRSFAGSAAPALSAAGAHLSCRRNVTDAAHADASRTASRESSSAARRGTPSAGPSASRANRRGSRRERPPGRRRARPPTAAACTHHRRDEVDPALERVERRARRPGARDL